MSDDLPTEPVSPSLRREALLPNERSRGLGTVAVVCTMAGVASGLALATTLMAMQVADTMSARTCTYRAAEIAPVELRGDQGFLGIRYVFANGVAQVDSVLPGTPAALIGLAPGDRVISVNANRVDSANELQELIAGASPGSRPTLLVERDGNMRSLRPTLVGWPPISY